MANIKIKIVECECGVVQIQFFQGANIINLLVPKDFTTMLDYPKVQDAVTDYIVENLDNAKNYSIGVFKFEGSFNTEAAYDTPIPVENDGNSFIVKREIEKSGSKLN